MLLSNQPIQQLDIPNKNNRIYSKAAIQEMLSNIEEKRNARALSGNTTDLVSGTIGMPEYEVLLGWESIKLVPINDVSHRVTDLKIIDDWLVGDIETLNTPAGITLEKMLTDKVRLDFRIAAYAMFKSSSEHEHAVEVYDIKLHSINAIDNGA